VSQAPTGKSWLDFDQLAALVGAAGELDASARGSDHRARGRRALLAALFLSGLRVSELCALRWSDVDLERELIHVRRSKTPAGVRSVPIGALLLSELRTWSDASRSAGAKKPPAAALVYPTARGSERDRNNIRTRVLAPACRRANERLAKDGEAPLPALTNHAGRRTAITWWAEAAVSVRRVMAWVGHRDARMTIEVYQQLEQRRPDPRIKAAMAVSWLRDELAREGPTDA